VDAYLDSSVLLRVVLGEPNRLREWPRIGRAFSSEILRVECLRVLDRVRLEASLPDRELARRRATFLSLMEGIDLVRLNRPVLERAADPFPINLRTLDALHLASASLLSRRYAALRFATHDVDLAAAARATGLRVVGAPTIG
jgi:predicted nucleic acid-binding protein